VTGSPDDIQLQRLEPRRAGMAAKVAALGVIGVAAAIVATGLLGDGADGGSAAVQTFSPRPSLVAPASVEPLREPLPGLELGAADAGIGRIVVSTGFGPGYVERSSGRLLPIDIEANGHLIPAGADGWLCVCESRPWSSDTERVVVRLVRVGNDGRLGEVVVERELTAARSAPTDGHVVSVDGAVAPGGATAALGWVGRQEDGSWRFEVELVRLRPDGVAGAAVVAELPPEPGTVEANGPFLSFDPSGTWLAAGLWALHESQAGASFAAPRWIIPLFDGRPGDVRPLADTPVVAEGQSDEFCNEEGWAESGMYAAVCVDPGGTRTIRRWSPDGRALEPLDPGPTFQVDGIGIRLGGMAGTILAWDPYGHRLSSMDIVGGDIRVSPRGGGPPDYPGDGVPLTDRSMLFGNPGAFAVTSDGDRAYALGEATGPGDSTVGGPEAPVRSTGVWVLDLATRRIIDHWPATARYHQIAVSPDGREVIAVGMAGMDADGRANPGQLHSITVFDAVTGDVRLVAGELDGAGWVSLP
jgi:hypothetical protein